MLSRTLLVSIAAGGLALSSVARADHYYNYRPEPQVRLGVDVIWGGGYGGYRPAPPSVWYPAPGYGYGYAPPPPVYYGPPRWAYDGPPGYWGGRGHWRRHHREDCDD